MPEVAGVRGNPEEALDWSSAAAFCRDVLRDVPGLATRVVAAIRQVAPAYATVPWHEHHTAVADQLRDRLTALAERRPLTEAELAAAGTLAAQRARQGIPIDAVVAAYQAADRQIWDLLVTEAPAVVLPAMPHLGSLTLEATGETTRVITLAHSRVARELDGGRITLGHQFLEMLDTDLSVSAASVPAARLGLDPEAAYIGLVLAQSPDDDRPAHDVASLIRAASDRFVVRPAADRRFEIVAELADAQVAARLLAGIRGDGRVGVGSVRPGMAGAAMSLGDARMAINATDHEHRVVHFDEEWLWAVVLTERHRLPDVVGRAVTTAREQPHLADAVRAMVSNDMRLVTAARHLQLHANSLTYRLERWHQLTGLDPRTFHGLSTSALACRVAHNHPSGGP